MAAIHYCSSHSFLFLFVTASLFSVCTSSTVCRRYSFGEDTVFYCSHNCCGNYHNQYCCDKNTPIIIGACVNLVVFVIVVIMLVVCYNNRRRASHGTVVNTQGQGGMVFALTAPYPAPHPPGANAYPMGGPAAAPPQPYAYGPPVGGPAATYPQPPAYGPSVGGPVVAPPEPPPYSPSQPGFAYPTKQ